MGGEADKLRIRTQRVLQEVLVIWSKECQVLAAHLNMLDLEGLTDLF